jgi:hypothetical protein
LSDELCRIGLTLTPTNTVDVGAPMKHKQVCYEMLRAAKAVITRTPDSEFSIRQRSFAIVMCKTGTVDVSAPLPHRELALLMLDRAREVVERFNDDRAPEMRPFSDRVMG